MKRYIIAATLTLCAAVAFAAPKGKGKDKNGKIHGELKGMLMATGGGRVTVIDAKGKNVWQAKAKNCHDVWMLPNGNAMFADGNVTEINPKDNSIVFQFKPKNQKGGGAYSCQRLDNGNTVIGENSTGRVLEVDKDGKIVFELQTKDSKPGNHHNLRMVRKLKSGNYLVCHSGPKFVREYSPDGKVVLEIKTDHIAFSAVRLPNGNTMVGHIVNVTEFDKDGKRVWEFNKKDAGDVKIGMMTGIHVQPNGNVVVGIYGADNTENGAALFEVTREKKILWRYTGKDRSMMGVQLLSPEGTAITGDVLR